MDVGLTTPTQGTYQRIGACGAEALAQLPPDQIIINTAVDKIPVASALLLVKDIKQDRLAALDAKDTWSLLMQLTYTIDLLLDNPDYFAMVVRTTPQVAAQHRAELAEKYDLGGQPWRWTPEDLGLLLLKSLL